MRGYLSLRWLVPLVSALAGMFGAAVFTSSCSSGSGCDCSEPRPIVEGEFEDVRAVVPESAPLSLRGIELTRLTVADGTVVVDYTRDGELGTATFTFSAMY